MKVRVRDGEVYRDICRRCGRMLEVWGPEGIDPEKLLCGVCLQITLSEKEMKTESEVERLKIDSVECMGKGSCALFDQLQAKLAAAEKVCEAAREYLESQDYHAYMACSSSAVSNRETLKNIADRRGLLRQALAAYEEGAE